MTFAPFIEDTPVQSLTSRHGILALIIFVVGALVVLELNDSPWLPGAHADSVQYMEAGESLAQGDGLTVPFASWTSEESVSTLSHFPPGMSLAIGGIMNTTGVRKHVAALWVLCFAAGLSLSLTFLIGSLVGGWGAGLLATAMVAFMPPFVLAHVAVWSEPLYVSLLLLTLLAMLRLPDRPWIAGIVAAGTVLVRYLGLAAVLGLGVWTYARSRDWKKTAVSVLPGTLAFGLWTLWTRTQGETVRTIGEYAGDFTAALGQLPHALAFWLAPGTGLVVPLVLAAAGIGAFVLAPKTLKLPISILLGAHLLVILASRLALDARIPFDERMLLPVFVLATIGVAAGLATRKTPAYVIVLAWVIFLGREDYQGIRSIHQGGLYYSSPHWVTSELIFWVDNRMHGMDVYTNEPGLLWFLSEQPARTLPLVTHDFAQFVEVWNHQPGAIVLVAPLRPDEQKAVAYLDALDVAVVHSSDQGIILYPRTTASALSTETEKNTS